MLTELFAVQITAVLNFMDNKSIKLTEPCTWNLDGRAHPGPPVTVFDVSVGAETVIILDRDTAQVKITWHPANPDMPRIDFGKGANMTHMTVLRALNHAVVEAIVRM